MSPQRRLLAYTSAPRSRCCLRVPSTHVAPVLAASLSFAGYAVRAGTTSLTLSRPAVLVFSLLLPMTASPDSSARMPITSVAPPVG